MNQVKALAVKTNDLGSVPEVHMVEGQTQS